MDTHRNLTTNAVGFCLLPSELIQNIILYLALPEIVRLKIVSKFISSIISDRDFIRQCNNRSNLGTWLFVYKKRWRRDSILHGFTDRSDRWFRIPIADILFPVIHPLDDLYLLMASGNFFLFASNSCLEVIAVNLMTNTVKRIPPSPLGPRGTSSWRRSGMKLVAGPSGSDSFRFLFAELHQNRPVLFEYDSETDKWQSTEAIENTGNLPRVGERGGHFIFLSVVNGRSGSVVIAVGSQSNDPVVLRPRFAGVGNEEQQLAIGFSWGNVIDRLHVYGGGNMMIVRSNGVDDVNRRVRMLEGIELWGLSLNGRCWEFISKVPIRLIEKIKKPYGVMMGCLEEKDGIIRAVLMSNYEGLWDIIWLSYDIGRSQWTWVPLPDYKMKGSNTAGITFSSGLTLV